MGALLFVLLIAAVGITLLFVTVYGAVRAGQNGEAGWVVGIILGWIIGIGWLLGLVYLLAVDPRRRVASAVAGSTGGAGWHPDPTARHEARYWDGARWTEHVTDQGRPGTDPV